MPGGWRERRVEWLARFNSNYSPRFCCTVVSFETDEKEPAQGRWEMLIMLIEFWVVSGNY